MPRSGGLYTDRAWVQSSLDATRPVSESIMQHYQESPFASGARITQPMSRIPESPGIAGPYGAAAAARPSCVVSRLENFGSVGLITQVQGGRVPNVEFPEPK